MKHPLDRASVTKKFVAEHLIAADIVSKHQVKMHRKLARIVRAHKASLEHTVEEEYFPHDTVYGPENWYRVTITKN